MCMFALTVSTAEPKNIKEAMVDSAWIEAMQEELHIDYKSGNSLTNPCTKSWRVVWLSNQSLPVEAVVVTATSSLQGAAIGGLMGSFTSDLSLPTSQPPPGSTGPMASLQSAQSLSGGPLIQARNFAVMTGVNAGISYVLKRLGGGKEDVQSSIATAFGSDAVFTLVSSSGAGMAPPNLAANALSSGLLFALMQGGLFKLGEKFSKPPTATKDVLYTKTRGMLTSLGLHHYEKNFKSGLLTDTTLPLLIDNALRDVKIPPGPRLLIIDHIQRQEFAPSVHGKNAFQSYMGYLKGCSKLLFGSNGIVYDNFFRQSKIL
ncbi:mitochondrial import inner membrane translocase subunit TIM22 [Tanacetum coccineum]|uniref:Mitochondrial import inner membrane translocase subunit TIM22 n=1 Tax=Tanacetum coccineum TaxID=301880 RepID=A0ABQ5J0W3_9ASTR